MQATDEVQKKIKAILFKLQANAYCEETDEGLLEIDIANYEDCFYVDMTTVSTLLDQEQKRLKEELQQAQQDSMKLVKQLD